MRNVILDLAVTLDGFIESLNGEIDWCIIDEDMNFDGFLSTIDTIFYGRASYDIWGNFNPEINAPTAELKLWAGVHSKKNMFFRISAEWTIMPHLSISIFQIRLQKLRNKVEKTFGSTVAQALLRLTIGAY